MSKNSTLIRTVSRNAVIGCAVVALGGGAALARPAEHRTSSVAAFDPAHVPPPDPARSKPIVRVFNEYFYRDTGSVRNGAQRPQAGGFVWSKLIDALISDNNITARQDEVAHFIEFFDKISEAKEAAESKDHRPAKHLPRTAPEEEKARQFAVQRIIGWRCDSTLYARYHGPVAHSEMSPLEPVGAYKRYIEDMEKKKVVQYFDKSARAESMKYLTMKRDLAPAATIDFRSPWWMRIPAKQRP